MQSLMSAVAGTIAEATGQKFENPAFRPVAGGDINRCFRMKCGEVAYFVKINSNVSAGEMFAAEARALAEMAATECISVPSPVTTGAWEANAFLVLEYLHLNGPRRWQLLGESLARLHKNRRDYFGWSTDNFIGSTRQINHRTENWAEFWWKYRLRPQIELALHNGHAALADWEIMLSTACQNILGAHQPAPSLVHGDLWSGNVGFNENGDPVLYDPAPYYGDREVDIAMTQLFGGFPAEFYRAYEEAWPLPPGSAQRFRLYDLYHLLNHLNLFGSAYLRQCLQMIQALCTKT